jgi:hypothetical protein
MMRSAMIAAVSISGSPISITPSYAASIEICRDAGNDGGITRYGRRSGR